LAVLESCFLLFWIGKQLLITKPQSDKYNPENYCYILSPITNHYTIGNIVRPEVLGIYGGRVLIAKEDVYLIRDGYFQKTTLTKLRKTKLRKAANLDNCVLIDSGVKINKKQTQKMDFLVGQKAQILVKDCHSLSSGKSLGILLIKRQFLKYINQ
jgi:hypothetical protein